MSSLYKKTTNSLKWSALTVIAPRIISPIVTITLARILAPESFGLVAIAMIVISFSQMFWEAGLSRALIQTVEDEKKVANIVFWSNVSLGIIIYSIIFITAPLLSIYFKSPQSLPVLRLLSVQIVIMSFTTVQEALFTKDLNFRPLFWIRIIVTTSSGLFSVLLALYGLNVWALVFGTLIGSFVNLFMLWSKSNWRPNFRIDWLLAPKLFRFGSWIVVLSIMGWLINWFDSLLVGKYLGMTDLGIYRTGVTMVSMLFSLIMGPIYAVMFPSFSKLQNNKKEITKHFHEINKIIIFLVLPIGIGLLLTSKDFVPLIFGEKWEGMSSVIGILGLSEGLALFVGINPTIFESIGKSDLQPKLSFFLLPLFVITYLLIAPLGIKPLLMAKLGLTLLSLPLNMALAVKVLKISPFYIFKQGKFIFISTISFTVSVLGLQMILGFYSWSSHLIVLLASISVGIFVYLGTLWLLDRQFITNLLKVIKSIFQRTANLTYETQE